MPKAVLVESGDEYLPDVPLAELKEMYRHEPPDKSRDRLQAAVLRKRDKMIVEISAISGRHPSTIHRWLHRLERVGLEGRYGRWGREGINMAIDYNEDDGMAARVIKDWPASSRERGRTAAAIPKTIQAAIPCGRRDHPGEGARRQVRRGRATGGTAGQPPGDQSPRLVVVV